MKIHKLAFNAAMASHCAGEQGKFWEMHDRLFQNQQALEPWSHHAEAIGLDVAEFKACMSSGKYAGRIRRDMYVAQQIGATGTPSFVLAITDPENPLKVKGVAFIRGAQPFSTFRSQIDQALATLEK